MRTPSVWPRSVSGWCGARPETSFSPASLRRGPGPARAGTERWRDRRFEETPEPSRTLSQSAAAPLRLVPERVPRHEPGGLLGPLGSGPPGFTLGLRLQGQFRLDGPPLGPHERAGLPTLSVVRAFVGEPTATPSADFCAAMAVVAEPLSPGSPDTTQTLPRRDRPPSPHTRRICHPGPSMAVDFAVTGPFVRPGRPRIRFLSIGSRLWSALSRTPSAATPLRS